MKKSICKYKSRLLIMVMAFALAVAMTACGKKNVPAEAGSSVISSGTQEKSKADQQTAPADTDKKEAPADKDKTKDTSDTDKAETPAGEDKEKDQAGEEAEQKSEENEQGGIIENEGQLEIIVPDEQDTFGE